LGSCLALVSDKVGGQAAPTYDFAVIVASRIGMIKMARREERPARAALDACWLTAAQVFFQLLPSVFKPILASVQISLRFRDLSQILANLATTFRDLLAAGAASDVSFELRTIPAQLLVLFLQASAILLHFAARLANLLDVSVNLLPSVIPRTVEVGTSETAIP
jgi:hypothetical protein